MHNKLRALLLIVFFTGGASALAYEVAWERQLSLAFGVSVYATSAVLTALMGGMALGSWLFGRVAARAAAGKADPSAALLRLYALLQAGLGVCALLAALVFPSLPTLYVWVFRRFEPDFYTLNVIRFGLAALVLLLPSTLMGGTLPTLSQLLARQERSLGREVGTLYAANTFGGVVGAFAAGLFLIRLLGVNTTIYVAAALDLLIAGIALLLSFRTASPLQPSPGQPAAAGPRPRKGKQARRTTAASPGQLALVLWGAGLAGLAALGYEVLWTRILAIFSISAVFSFTIMLTIFLTGLALGGALAARWVDRSELPLRLFGYLQLGVGLCAILVLFVFARLPTLLGGLFVADTFGKLVTYELVAAAITMLAPAVLMGATFPVAVRIYGGGEAVGRRVGRLYAVNTLGSTVGPWLAGFVLIPLLGLQRASLTLAIVNLALGSIALLTLTPVPRLPLGGALAAVIVAVLLLPPGVYLGFREETTPSLVFYREGVDATVAVFQVQQPPLKISFVNGRNEVPTDRYSMRAFYLLGHLPPLLHPGATSALVVSFGNGITTGALSRHAIPEIQAIELVSGQIEAAAIYSEENRGVLDYPGLHLTIEDGRNYLLRSEEQFDIITADATHPINTSSWALFTREFYTLASRRLAEDGVMMQWLPFHDLAEGDYRDVIKTFQSVFPHTSLWYTGGTHSFLVATPQPLDRSDVAALGAQIGALGIAGDIGDGEQVASYFLMDEQAVAAYVKDARVVTDNTAFFVPARDMDPILQGLLRHATPAEP
jgi:spermidine synthase